MSKGWGILVGVPSLFAVAALLTRLPAVAECQICAVRRFLGVPCPGCGLTHAFMALMQGRLRASIDAHPLGPVIALWLAYFFVRQLWAVLFRRQLPELLTQRERDWLVGAFLLALFLQWAVKLATI